MNIMSALFENRLVALVVVVVVVIGVTVVVAVVVGVVVTVVVGEVVGEVNPSDWDSLQASSLQAGDEKN